MEKSFSNFIKQLNESSNKIHIYHFTHLINLYSILESKTFILKFNDLPNYNYDFSFSCTRNKSFKWGNIRIVLDYEKIQQRFIVKPVSYFKFNKTQAEELIFTNKETFPIFNYIIHIDILSHLENDVIFNDVLQLLKENNINYNLVERF